MRRRRTRFKCFILLLPRVRLGQLESIKFDLAYYYSERRRKKKKKKKKGDVGARGWRRGRKEEGKRYGEVDEVGKEEKKWAQGTGSVSGVLVVWCFGVQSLLLQKIVRCTACNVWVAFPRGRIELEEGVLQVLVDLHDGGLVATAVAVVGGAENRDGILFMAPIIALCVVDIV